MIESIFDILNIFSDFQLILIIYLFSKAIFFFKSKCHLHIRNYWQEQPIFQFSILMAKWYFLIENYSDLLWEKLRKTFEIRGWRPRIYKNFEITWTIHSNSERSEQFVKQNAFLTCTWRFLRSNKFQSNYNSNCKKIFGI